MTNFIDWQDGSGTSHRYWFLATPANPTSIKAEAGNYAFITRLPNGNFTPIYFGIADNLRNRISAHDRWDDAVRAGATHIVAHTTPNGAFARENEERALVLYWKPPLNTHHKKAQ